SSLQSPVHYFSNYGSFYVTEVAYNIFGCTDTARKFVGVEGYFTFYLPTSFTPNEDGKNDVFVPLCSGVLPQNYQMQIYDRWGNLMYSTLDLTVGWDGRAKGGNEMTPTGIYIYYVQFMDFKNEMHSKYGTLTLI